MLFSIDPVRFNYSFDKSDVFVLFLEGTRSNGRGILKSQIEQDELTCLDLDILLYGIKYDGDFCVPIAFGSELLHFMNLLVANVNMKVYNTNCLRDDAFGSMSERDSTENAINVNKTETRLRKKIEVVPSVMDQLSTLLRLKLLGLGLEDKKLFLEFYKDKNTKK